MQRAQYAAVMLTGLAVVLSSAATALAHIDLLEPEARAHGTAARGDTDIDANSNLKQGPCGQVLLGRTERVATYAAGQTITVRVREENAHVSYLRVSIDLDGSDFTLRPGPVPAPETQDEALAAELALGAEGLLTVYREDNDTPGFVHELQVTLPDVACDNCTLQVVQYMYDDPAAPYYFQCADLVITSGAGADAGAMGSEPPAALDPEADPSDGNAAAAIPSGSLPRPAPDPESSSAPIAMTTMTVAQPPTMSPAAEPAAGRGEVASSDASPAPSDGGCTLVARGHAGYRALSLCLLAAGLGFGLRRQDRGRAARY